MSNLSEILNARESRTAMRLDISKRKMASISLSFNIPGATKSNADISKAFAYTVNMLDNFLLANRILINKNESRQLIDAAGNFYLVPVSETAYSNEALKTICETFEQQHFLSRIIDVDFVDDCGNPISSGKEKRCFICNNSAVSCMRSHKHSIKELLDFVNDEIGKYLKINILKQVKARITAYATQALLLEISLSPKPGLVDRYNNGAHKDMDFFSFVSSTSALSAYWIKIIELANNYVQNKHGDVLIQLRIIGIEMETEMKRFTNGVNTHKGAIFIIGMLVYAVAKLIFEDNSLTDSNIQTELIALNKDNLKDELLGFNNNLAHGKQIYDKYGTNIGGGIRKEMSLGLPIVFKHAIKILQKAHKDNKDFLNKETTAQRVLTKCLLQIISQNNDSNILHRANIEILDELKQKAANCLNNEYDFRSNYNDLCKFCIKHNISPGGSADLLSASIFLHQVQSNF